MVPLRTELAHGFSERLVELLQARGYISKQAKGGVVLKPLALVAGCSVQMARKYTLGLSLPDYMTLRKIAVWLDVSPSWLIYGENLISNIDLDSQITLDRAMVSYLLQALFSVFLAKTDRAGLAEFIIDVMVDLGSIKTDTPTLHKMIDMAVTSAYRFKLPN